MIPQLRQISQYTVMTNDISVYVNVSDRAHLQWLIADRNTPRKVVWRDRSFPRASLVMAEGRFIILDEDGNLALSTASAEGLTVHAKFALLSNNSWTAPTLVGTRLYVRDRKNLLALDLGAR